MPPPEQLYGSVPPAKEEVLFKCLNFNFDKIVFERFFVDDAAAAVVVVVVVVVLFFSKKIQ